MIQQTPMTPAAGIKGVASTLVTGIFGSPANPPFPATQPGTFTGTPSLATKFEDAVLLQPVKDLLGVFGLQTQPVVPGSPLLSLLPAPHRHSRCLSETARHRCCHCCWEKRSSTLHITG